MFIQLNFAMIMPLQVREHAMDLSTLAAQLYDAYFFLGAENKPHITVVSFEIDDSNKEEIIERLMAVVANGFRLRCKAEGVRAEGDYIQVKIHHSREIEHLHSRIEKALHTPPVPNYSPHLTLTRVENPVEPEKAASTLTWNIPIFEVHTLGLFVSGENGTCRKLLKKFELSSSLSKSA